LQKRKSIEGDGKERHVIIKDRKRGENKPKLNRRKTRNVLKESPGRRKKLKTPL